jgi:hypothetical protein
MFNFSIFKDFSVTKIQLGSGVVGKLNALGMLLILVIGILAYTLIKNEWAILGLIIAMLIAFILFCKSTFAFAEKNPEIAVLDGAQLVMYKRTELGGKQINIPKESPLTNRPSNLNKAIKNK